MNTAKSRKLQYLLINQLLEKGSVQLLLPDGMRLDIGIVQEDEFGKIKKEEDYCYVVASRDGKTAMIDSYNVGVQYEEEKNTMVYEDETFDDQGRLIKTFDVV
jgi:hypothetical protein